MKAPSSLRSCASLLAPAGARLVAFPPTHGKSAWTCEPYLLTGRPGGRAQGIKQNRVQLVIVAKDCDDGARPGRPAALLSLRGPLAVRDALVVGDVQCGARAHCSLRRGALTCGFVGGVDGCGEREATDGDRLTDTGRAGAETDRDRSGPETDRRLPPPTHTPPPPRRQPTTRRGSGCTARSRGC